MRRIFILMVSMMSLVNSIPSYTFALGPNTVDSAAIIDGQVKTADIDLLAVTTDKIDNGAVTDAKITGPISANKLEKPANVIIVAKSGGDYTSISAALASLPDPNIEPVIIKVQPGTYTENIVMKSNVYLQGAGKNITTIYGLSSSDTINISSISNVSISGFTISGPTGYNNFYIESSDPMIIDNHITGNRGGATLVGSSALIQNNDFSTTRGPLGVSGGNPLIKGNRFAMWGCVITISDSSAIIIENHIESPPHSGYFNIIASSAKVVNNIIKGLIRGIGIGGNGIDGSRAIIRGNIVTDSMEADIHISGNATPNISFNIYDTFISYNDPGVAAVGLYNVKTDGTPAPLQ